MNSSEPQLMPDPSIQQAVMLITACWLPVAKVGERLAVSKAETCEFDTEIGHLHVPTYAHNKITS
jgi:hypothetical protein